ncbi:MAG: hypothetical protein OEU68_16000 [Nitrospira sp.]|nr:hypothetical protein [Nitrospira sp.]MDH4243280.1 hypothetical protein [Nitrospira sp.]MDH4357079.1 hypothetical protein [Nitrospira sp.]MDH5317376.1 hypothetical protein [Nitrospira sp.]
MDIVAIGALHLAFTDWHVCPVECHGSLDRMALTAQLELRGRSQIRMAGLRVMDRMAGHTGHIAYFMGASLPEESAAFHVTLETDGVLADSRLWGT